jgi:PhoPQ-activated pathogenicity-related protein
MRISSKYLGLLVLALAGCRPASIPASAQNQVAVPVQQTALDRFLAKPEPAYHWEEIKDGEFANTKDEVNLRLTSQTWQGKPWEHRLQVFLPQATPETEIIPDAAVIWVTFGNGSLGETVLGQSLAKATGAVTVNLFGVPNQPLYGKSEDALIAYTFAQYLQTGDESWPLLFPMTKSVTKAMDAISEWSEKTQGHKITRFIITGGSKRGWTTYLAAEGDKRVVGIVPLVYDNLNIGAQLENQKKTWGAVSDQIGDYAKLDLPNQADNPRGKQLLSMVDPYAMIDRLTIPKLLIMATNDRYWAHNSFRVYEKELPKPWNLFYVPNAPHTLGAGQLSAGMAAAGWSRRILRGAPMPTLTLTQTEANNQRTFALKVEGGPAEALRIARLWHTAAPTADLRTAKWESLELEPRNGLYQASIPVADGHEAAFAEVEIGDARLPIKLSSTIWENSEGK